MTGPRPTAVASRAALGEHRPASGVAAFPQRFLGIAIALAATSAEVGLAALFVLGRIEPNVALLVHVALAVALVWSLAWIRRNGRRVGSGTLLFVVATIALGPVGACGAILTNLLLRYLSKETTSRKAWHETLAGGLEPGLAQRLQRRIVDQPRAAHERSGVAPFADVMTHGSLEQKQAVIALIAGKFQPGFAPPLLAALNDAEATVRVMAATAAATIENQFLELSMALEEKRTADLADVSATIELARHYDNYANTGLLDAGRTKSARDRALELYRDAERRRAGDTEVLNAIIRLLVRLGRDSEAIEPFGALVASGSVAPESFVWYVECLFRLGRYETLRRTCARFDAASFDRSRLSERCRQALGLWAANSPSR